MNTPTIQNASVKVMRSHDYCHFEVCLSSSEATTPELVDALRKEAARLADKAVQQYRIAKASREREENIAEKWRLERALSTPEGDRSATEKGIIKYHQDKAYAARLHYDYEDDYDTLWDGDDDL
jgi:hypothetical protein